MKVMGAVFALVVLVMVIIMLPGAMTQINDVRIDTRIDSLNAPTGVGETTADVILVAPLWDGTIVNVLSITSDVGTDVPNPQSYNAGTRTLTVYGLTANEAGRTLDVEYNTSALGEGSVEQSGGTFMSYLPLLLILGVVIIIVGISVSFWRR